MTASAIEILQRGAPQGETPPDGDDGVLIDISGNGARGHDSDDEQEPEEPEEAEDEEDEQSVLIRELLAGGGDGDAEMSFAGIPGVIGASAQNREAEIFTAHCIFIRNMAAVLCGVNPYEDVTL